MGTQDPDNTQSYLFHDEQENDTFLPTRANILYFLSRGERRDKSNELDFLFFYFSGHGWSSQDGTDYLLTSDSFVIMPKDTAISVPMLEGHLRNWEAKHVVLFIDACRTVMAGGKSAIIPEKSRIDVKSLRIPGMVTFCSCAPGQTSYEADEISSGVFTEGVCKALGDEGRCSTIDELDKYLNDNVPRISDRHGLRPQTPYSRVQPLRVQKEIIVSQRTLERWQYQEHKEAKQATSEATTKQESIRRYRENVESAWADGQLSEQRAGWLKNRGKALALSARDMAEIERDVMGGTRKVILERQKKAAKEQEKIDRQKWLDERYAEARRLHRTKNWRAVVEVLAQIRAEEPTYPDPNRLLNSARQALQRTEEERDVLHQYHGAVQWAWADGQLDKRKIEDLRKLAHDLKLNSTNTAKVEREVMGDTKEAIQRKRYRKAVGEARASVDKRSGFRKTLMGSIRNDITLKQAKELRVLANQLGLGTDAAKIEREILGKTVEEVLRYHKEYQEKVNAGIDAIPGPDLW
jgi:hypothetical protein